MQIPYLNADSYVKCLEAGRTKPCLFFCSNDPGDMDGEYVVKLKAGIDKKETGLAFELIASQLARFLNIKSPDPAIIRIDAEIGRLIDNTELATKIMESVGLNFGSKFITGGFSTWPIGMEVPSTLMQSATEIFAFDALIQNPDRRVEKPNILWKGDELYIIDHEMSFSFVYDIFPSLSPWKINSFSFLKGHLFYRSLQRKTLNLDRFHTALKTLSDETIETLLLNIPQEWNNDKIFLIAQHLKIMLEHIDEFIEEIRRFLQ
jgi:hypothetical protein